MVREPAVAGVFYPSGRTMLKDSLRDCFMGPLGPGRLPEVSGDLERPLGAIVPHAGYMYSGQISAWAYLEVSRFGNPKTVVLIGPNHTGYGSPVSVYPSGIWRTPLGDVEVDEKGVQLIIENSSVVRADETAHRFEHSLEVQLPFLQFTFEGFKIIPIVMMDQSPKATQDLSRALKSFLTLNPGTLVIASTDLNHYEDHETTLRKDSLIIEALEKNDPRLLYKAVYEMGVSMCGYGPVATLMMLEIGEFKLLKHATSGEVSGDYLEVVGYLSAVYE